MALSTQLAQAGYVAENIGTTCTITLEKVADGSGITASQLELKARVPGATQEAFHQAAKAGCPVSKLFRAEITLSATLL